MRLCTLLTLFALAGFAVAAPEKVVPNRDWIGVSDDEKAKKHAPKDSFIVNAADFTKLWKAWRKDEKVPQIDFKTQFVWVTLAEGPNRPTVTAELEDGKLKIESVQTLIGGDGFGYSIATFPRKGVKSVNGKEIPKATTAAAPQKVVPTKNWVAIVNDETLKEKAPKEGVITTAKAFETLWKAWRKEKVPEIDFEKQFVLVTLASGPNSPNVSATLDDGNLKVVAFQTQKGGKGFGYSIATFNRAGVKKINGKEMPKE